MSDHLASWNDTPTREAIVDFVERVTTEGGPDYVPPAERIAVFDNDGTLWCEKPMPIELGFILVRLAEMAEAGRVAAREAAVEGGPREGLRTGSASVDHQALPRRRQRREGADGAASSRRSPGMTRRGVLGRRRRVPARRRSTRRSAARSATAATCRWSSCCATSRRTASPTTSPRAATATSCGRSPRRSTASRRSG